MITVFDALQKMYPNFAFKVDKYNNITWIDEITNKPTQEQIQAKIAELKAAEPLRLLREERDRRLASTDWRATIDYPGDDQTAWLEYRQALRDVTKQDPNNITWPEEP